ncbi:hypothetical protein RUM43_000547 [Polyplax serrata]|uniref:Uncharacterized protein n=1 Tax=Polyplax serrata TaxID=468196 RepID=A0AAN8SCN6_POLSC
MAKRQRGEVNRPADGTLVRISLCPAKKNLEMNTMRWKKQFGGQATEKFPPLESHRVLATEKPQDSRRNKIPAAFDENKKNTQGINPEENGCTGTRVGIRKVQHP